VARCSNRSRAAIPLTEYDGVTSVEPARRLGLSVSVAISRGQCARGFIDREISRCGNFETDRDGKILDFTPRTDRGDCSNGEI